LTLKRAVKSPARMAALEAEKALEDSGEFQFDGFDPDEDEDDFDDPHSEPAGLFDSDGELSPVSDAELTPIRVEVPPDRYIKPRSASLPPSPPPAFNPGQSVVAETIFDSMTGEFDAPARGPRGNARPARGASGLARDPFGDDDEDPFAEEEDDEDDLLADFDAPKPGSGRGQKLAEGTENFRETRADDDEAPVVRRGPLAKTPSVPSASRPSATRSARSSATESLIPTGRSSSPLRRATNLRLPHRPVPLIAPSKKPSRTLMTMMTRTPRMMRMMRMMRTPRMMLMMLMMLVIGLTTTSPPSPRPAPPWLAPPVA
jgi:hypothetical protein